MVLVAAVFTVAFSGILLLLFSLWKRVLTLKERAHAADLASFVNAGLHGTVATAWAFWLLFTSSDWTDFDAANTPAQNLAISLSIGYFVADTFAYLVPCAPDPVFFAHHAITVLFLACSLHLQRGAHACLFGVCIGEITNPAFHLYNVLNALRPTRWWAQSAFHLWAPIFTAFFVATRSMAGPLVSVWWCRKVAAMDAPLLHKSCWIVTSVGITAVSQLFTRDFVRSTRELMRSRRKKAPPTTIPAAPPPPQSYGEDCQTAAATKRRVASSIYDSAREIAALSLD